MCKQKCCENCENTTHVVNDKKVFYADPHRVEQSQLDDLTIYNALRLERKAENLEREAKHLREKAAMIRDAFASDGAERLALHQKILEGHRAEVLLEIKRKGL